MLGVGESGSATFAIAAGAGSFTASLTWGGSDFDLTLTSPSGRQISETTIDPDVTVAQSPASVRIAVASPEAGQWQLSGTGVDVPAPEEVTYRVEEVGSPVRTALYLDGQGAAGVPFDLRLLVTERAIGIAGASVTGTVTDPSGISHPVSLTDHGGQNDRRADDGLYGYIYPATDQPGSYTVRISVDGVDGSGQAFHRMESGSFFLSAKVDTDGDGIADATETMLGLNPADASDGAIDHDADGLSTSQELAVGSDPYTADTDQGGESDGSEVVGGRDPFVADDDDVPPAPLLDVTPSDGRQMTVRAATFDQTGSVQLTRLSASGKTDLGSVPGTGSTFTDGPLAAGDYWYRAVSISTSGSESKPVVVGPYTAADDVTPPSAMISVNGGAWTTSNPTVSVDFFDVSEPVVQMRLAESEDDLATASWVPYSASTTFTVGSESGIHVVYAQVKDAAGLASDPASGVVDLASPPSSTAGPIPASFSTDTFDVPVTVQDNGSGPYTIELWHRMKAEGAILWGAWTTFETKSAGSGQTTFTYQASEDGTYQFYSVVVDSNGNRESPPVSPDSSTVVDVTDDPPAVHGSFTMRTGGSVTISGSGTGSDDRSIVSVDWALYGIKGDGRRQRILSWTPTFAADGAFDERSEAYTAQMILTYQQASAYVSYEVNVRANAGNQKTTLVLTVP